jgi:DNA gyrase subunit A
MLITSGGVLIRTRVSEVREMGRSTQGVTLINLGEGEKLSGLQAVMDSDEDDEGNGNGSGNGSSNGNGNGNGNGSSNGSSNGNGSDPAPA